MLHKQLFLALINCELFNVCHDNYLQIIIIFVCICVVSGGGVTN